jgi:hypothetical protein
MGTWFSARQDPLPHETPAQGSAKKHIVLSLGVSKNDVIHEQALMEGVRKYIFRSLRENFKFFQLDYYIREYCYKKLKDSLNEKNLFFGF